MFYMKAYPIELRKRVLSAVEEDVGTRKEIAAMFQVSTFWIRKLLRQRRDTGNIAPKPQNQGRKPVFQGKNLKRLEQFIEAHPDATLEETKQYFLGVVECSIVTIHNTLKRLELRYKKNRCVPANKTERM